MTLDVSSSRFVFTIGSSLTSSIGHKLHSGFWTLKLIFFILLHFASIFIPYQALINYSYLQSVGAAFFLLVQIVLLIDFCYDAADWFKANGFTKVGSLKPCWGILMFCVVVACLSSIIAMIVLGFRWFTTPVANTASTLGESCGFNIFVMAFATILVVVSTVLQIVVLARTRNGSIVTALFISTYVMWNTFSGLLASKVCQSQIQVFLAKNSLQTAFNSNLFAIHEGLLHLCRCDLHCLLLLCAHNPPLLFCRTISTFSRCLYF